MSTTKNDGGEYRGILWDIEELPYFKGVKMSEEKKLTVEDAVELKLILEAQIKELVEEFEARTDLVVSSIDLMFNENDIDDVFVAVLL